MNLTEAMKGRHSVRQYTDQPLNEAVISALQKRLTPAIRRADYISSLSQTSRRPLMALWPTMENSAVLRTISQ